MFTSLTNPVSMRSPLRLIGLVMLTPLLLQAASDDPLYVQTGTDPTFAEILGSGKLPQGTNSTEGVTGSRIHVNKSVVEVGPNATHRIPQDIRIHTLGNSVIRRKEFPKWSRWYQEDGNTQVFRLFTGETNVRNSRPLAARIEAFSEVHWKQGTWHEWTGTYTIIKPHNATMFQVMNRENEWAVHLDMDDHGSIIFSPRRAERKVIARQMTGKPFHIRVRDNGHDYEVFLNGEKAGSGSYARPAGTTGFRWGMYLGEHPVEHDAMSFVTGAAIDPGQPVAPQEQP